VSRPTEQKRPDDDPSRRQRFAGPAGLRGLAEALRSVPDRLRRPEALLMSMAILASLGAHMPPWVGLGALRDYFAAHPEQPVVQQPPSEVSFELAAPADKAPEPAEPPPKPEREKPKKAKLAKREPEPEKSEPPKPEPPKPELPKPKLPDLLKPQVAELTVQPPPPPPKEIRKQSITQKSDDPEVAPPPDAQYLAEQSRRVEEETVARVTDLSRDDPEPSKGAPQRAGDDQQAGDADEDQIAMRQPSQKASPTQAPSEPTPPQASREPTPTQPSQRAVAAQKATPAQPAQPVIIQDPMGSFALMPAQPARAAQAAREGRAGSSGGPPNLKVSWRAFEETFGAEQLAQDRMPREAKRRGAGREKRWSEFRAAIENYVAGVKPGNTTALNAAADPFAAYLAAFHRNLHIEFAHEFLGSLPAAGELGDPNLVTKVEIVVNPDGTLDRVGVVGSSGNMMYDFGAFNAVQRGAPYPPTPEKIRSPDGRVYVRWALHRNESQCGTWNAEPYILRTAPRSPNDPPEDSVSPYRRGGSEPHGGDEPKAPAGPGKAVAPGETLGRARRRAQGPVHG
jgi:TonB family protein